MRRVTGSPWIADFRCWTWPEVAILGADQKERGLWELECSHRRKLDDVLTTSHMRRALALENFTSARRRRAISLSMLKVPYGLHVERAFLGTYAPF